MSTAAIAPRSCPIPGSASSIVFTGRTVSSDRTVINGPCAHVRSDADLSRVIEKIHTTSRQPCGARRINAAWWTSVSQSAAKASDGPWSTTSQRRDPSNCNCQPCPTGGASRRPEERSGVDPIGFETNPRWPIVHPNVDARGPIVRSTTSGLPKLRNCGQSVD